jgi:DNA modification methylase
VDFLKEKDLIGIPWRVAFALQADGWYLRQDIIWHKPNPMPESVRDRCTKAHEYLFMLSKGPRYHYDADAVAEPVTDSTVARVSQAGLAEQVSSDRVPGKTNGNMKAVIKKQDGHGRRHAGFNDRYFGQDEAKPTRNRRSVWTVTTKPYAGAHFATFPPDLIEPCILAGCPAGGTVLDPFGGSGTTAGVAVKHGRKAILCELNPEYAALVPDRVRAIAGDTPDMFMEAAE